MNKTKQENRKQNIYQTPPADFKTDMKTNAERLLNNLPLLMFGILMLLTLALG